ncbi:MAG: LamG domain-containing protein, partial [Bacteroides sp.]|nr:LamG domain-containing protein [Bacteroides sp.]
AYYPFDGNANDESGNGNDGSVNGAIEYVEGIVRQAAKLDGTNTYIRIANPVQKFDTQYTITGWVYTEGRGGTLVGKYTWGAPGGGRGFNLFSTTEGGNGVGHAGSTFFAHAMFNEGWNPSKYPKYTMPIGEFQYITAVYDEGNVKIYINGIVEAEKTVSHSGTLDNPYDMLIGTSWESNGTKIIAERTNRTFDGLIDELRLYNRALSESEIQQLYNDNAQTDCDEHAVYSVEKNRGKLTIPFINVPLLDGMNHQP